MLIAITAGQYRTFYNLITLLNPNAKTIVGKHEGSTMALASEPPVWLCEGDGDHWLHVDPDLAKLADFESDLYDTDPDDLLASLPNRRGKQVLQEYGLVLVWEWACGGCHAKGYIASAQKPAVCSCCQNKGGLVFRRRAIASLEDL